jgi:hypothetical protein
MYRASVFAFAHLHGQPVYQTVAEERGEKLSENLFTLRDDQTSRIPIQLSLTEGMSISCTQKNEPLGITNGTIGIVAGIEWEDNTTFQIFRTSDGVQVKKPSKLPKYVIITKLNPSNQSFGNLPPNHIPIPPTKKQAKMLFQNRSYTKTLKQVMIVPAFSITTDKSQGLTVSAAVIGSQKDQNRKRPPSQILYVALSRVTDPHMMILTEKLNMEYLLNFKPNPKLLSIDQELENRDTREFF